MAIQITPLPYNIDALEPVISVEALTAHFEEHYRVYVDKLNDLLPDTVYEDLSLKDIVLKSGKKIQWDHETKIFNNANQAWNHTFFWNCLTPARNMKPSDALLAKIDENFGTLAVMIEQFNLKAMELFGSGWVWLVMNKNKKLEIVSGKNAENPLPVGNIPIFVVDVWEHAYYVNYKSNRKLYLESVWQLVNWSFVENELLKAEKFQVKRQSSRDVTQSLPFYFRQKWLSSTPSFLKRRKTSIKSGTLLGAAIGAFIFFFVSIAISVGLLPSQGLNASVASGGANYIVILSIGVFVGLFVGAACGALVGIGTPMPKH